MKIEKYLNEASIKWIYILQDKSGDVFSATTSPDKAVEIINRFTKGDYNNGSLYNVEVSGKDTIGTGNNKVKIYKLPIL